VRSGKVLALKLCRIYGSQAAAARALGCSQPTVWAWLRGGGMTTGWRRLARQLIEEDRQRGGPEERKRAPRRRSFRP